MALDLKLRRTYLGATDLVAISGLSPWSRPGDVWMEKTGRSLGFEGNAATEVGQDLEPVVATRHARRRAKLGEIVQLGELTDPVYDKEFPFIAGNPDRIYLNRKRVLECKTASESQLYDLCYTWGEDGVVNGVPPYYYAQINHYIGELEFEDGFLSSFFLGKSRIQRDYPITFDAELFNLLRTNGAKFWNTYVVPNVQPPVELFGPTALMSLLASKAMPHGGKKGVLAEPDAYLEGLVSRYREIALKIDELDRQKGGLGGKIAAWIVQQQATKVIHSLGSFTYQQPEPKPSFSETDFRAAWAVLQVKLRENAAKIPDHMLQGLFDLCADVLADHTKEVTPDPGKPKLHPYWKPQGD